MCGGSCVSDGANGGRSCAATLVSVEDEASGWEDADTVEVV